jgi:predicted alpha/beta-hydrolase family hydrolase
MQVGAVRAIFFPRTLCYCLLMSTPFVDQTAEPTIRGFLHESAESNGNGIVLTHGAGSNCQAKLLVGMSTALAACGFTVLRFDLPFRLARPFGPPRPGSAERDREGLRRAVSVLRAKISASLFLGGHSYGGRQATMLVAEEPDLVDGLLLLSYPLHPPKSPAELRTKHFPKLMTPAFFVHGTHDPFGTIAEMQSALKLIPGPHALLEVDGAAHDLLGKKSAGDILSRIAREFNFFVGDKCRRAGH